jgi:hypothetical protein
VTPVAARASALALGQQAGLVSAAHRRLAAQRVDDTRLEGQRARVVEPLGEVSRLLTRMATLARAGDARGLVALLPDLRTAIDELREAGT